MSGHAEHTTDVPRTGFGHRSQEDPMRRRSRSARRLRPRFEQVEARWLLSVYTDLMIDNRQAALASLAAKQKQAYRPQNTAITTSSTSIATPSHQGPQGLNLALTPIGTLTPAEKRREMFSAKSSGSIRCRGGFSSEASQVLIQGAGTASSMLHSDIQMRLIVATDPTAIPNSGVATLYDRNLNTHTSLGFDLETTTPSFDSGGRPNRFDVVTIDPNINWGVYTEGFSQGVHLRYIPSGKPTKGVISQGKVYISIHAQIYSPNASTS